MLADGGDDRRSSDFAASELTVVCGIADKGK